MLIIDVHGLVPNTAEVTYVGRGGKHGWTNSALGNPFVGNDALVKYSAWLFAKIKERDEDILAALRSLTPTSVLGCWCCTANDNREPKKRRCHAEIVAAAWRYCQTRGLLNEIIESDLEAVREPATAVEEHLVNGGRA